MLGTRPEIIRLSLTIPILDEHSEHRVVHTGQNFTPELSDVFFAELGVRAPDDHLGIKSTVFAEQAAQIIDRIDKVLVSFRPDRVLILGDTNSGLSALPAARRGVPVFHLEAGNRCYDDRVPEEVNRRVIDHSSTVLMAYTHRAKENLVREGIERERIFVVGNPIFEVLNHFSQQINGSETLSRLGLEPRKYLLATMHRAENVDQVGRLERLVEGLHQASAACEMPLIVSVHPRTSQRFRDVGLGTHSPKVRFLEPMGFFDFVRLEGCQVCSRRAGHLLRHNQLAAVLLVQRLQPAGRINRVADRGQRGCSAMAHFADNDGSHVNPDTDPDRLA